MTLVDFLLLVCSFGGPFGSSFSVSGWCLFWISLVQFIYLVLVLPIEWVWIVLEMFWLSHVSVWGM